MPLLANLNYEHQFFYSLVQLSKTYKLILFGDWKQEIEISESG